MPSLILTKDDLSGAPPVYYKLTPEDKQFVEAAIKTGAPVSFSDVFMWMTVSKLMNCDFTQANEILKSGYTDFMDVIKKIQTGIITVPNFDKNGVRQ